MAVSRPTTFGTLQFGGDSTSPTLFAESFTPQTFSVSLSDAITDSEAELFSLTTPLADSMTLTEAQVVAITKILADSETITDATVAKTIQRVLSDSGTLTESAVVFTVKDLQDFLILKEWISIRLNKQIIWVNPSTNANIFDSLYGKYKYGAVCFGGLKPLATWTEGPTTRQPSVWTNPNGHKYNS